MAKEKPKKIELTEAELASLRERIRNKQITDDDLVIFDQVLSFMLWIQNQLERFKITAHKLRQLIFGNKTEKGNSSAPSKKSEQNVSLEENASQKSLDQDINLQDEPDTKQQKIR